MSHDVGFKLIGCQLQVTGTLYLVGCAWCPYPCPCPCLCNSHRHDDTRLCVTLTHREETETCVTVPGPPPTALYLGAHCPPLRLTRPLFARVSAQMEQEPMLMFCLPDLAVFNDRSRVDIAELPMTVQEMLVYATRSEHE